MILAICVVAAVGCGGRTMGGDPSDGGALPDAAVTLYDTYGHVWLTVMVIPDIPHEPEALMLDVRFFGEDYDPLLDNPGHVSTETTSDGVVCDIYMSSGHVDPPDPDLPPQVDGGRITTWAGFDPDRLEAVFSGDWYFGDSRNSDAPNWPAWIEPGAVAVQFEGEGSAHVGSFRTEVTLAMVPEILAPLPSDEPLLPDADGTFHFSWYDLPELADETIVSFQLLADGYDSFFQCYPAPGVDRIRLPFEWVEQWSRGSGYLVVSHLNTAQLQAGDAHVTVRTFRTRYQAISFAIDE